MPIYFAWFIEALLSVGGDASDQNLPQSGRLLYCVISGFTNIYRVKASCRRDEQTSATSRKGLLPVIVHRLDFPTGI
jgi:hypothetical protein